MPSIVDKDTLIKNSLLSFFSDTKNFQIFYNVVNKKTEYSLRVLEWFVSKYAEKNDIVYTFETPNGKTKEFNVFLDYRNQLTSYQKKCFDMFRRQSRFSISNPDNPKIEMLTTVGQMNFFKWAIENQVLDYVSNHLMEIKEDLPKKDDEEDLHTKKSDSSHQSENLLLPVKKLKKSKNEDTEDTAACLRQFKKMKLSNGSGGSCSSSGSSGSSISNGSSKKIVNGTEEKKKKKRQSISSVFATRTCIKRYKSFVIDFD